MADNDDSVILKKARTVTTCGRGRSQLDAPQLFLREAAERHTADQDDYRDDEL